MVTFKEGKSFKQIKIGQQILITRASSGEDITKINRPRFIFEVSLSLFMFKYCVVSLATLQNGTYEQLATTTFNSRFSVSFGFQMHTSEWECCEEACALMAHFRQAS